MKYFLWFTVPILASLLFVGGLMMYDAVTQDKNLIEEVKHYTTETVSEVKKIDDSKQRTAIATSYCSVKRKEGEVRIEEFNECISQHKNHPTEIYKAFTGDKLNQTWEELAPNEKDLVVEEVKAAELRIIANIDQQKMYEEMEKRMKDLLGDFSN